ncbi:hypothetical protein VCRA2123O443_40096 [Vibrio crassostreae]|nr:hypothetical protein VCRA2110O182_40244 [Vibrio crassostreae]CAK2347450.1 hypothetical protein VCRA2111O408_40246 [Vibrio crassostreae]CAK2352462.1 hypothetical protein VCRA211O406_30096 [Vibrio crassostreae]CAK3397026.1 hypothetical protein VCRA2123O443_40096 [Vibrio crassostreae]
MTRDHVQLSKSIEIDFLVSDYCIYTSFLWLKCRMVQTIKL